MTKASDNLFPRLLISEGGSTATPAANRVTVYAKSDGLLYSKDDAGAETALGGGGGDITTDPAWAAKGDLIVATGNNAASVLTAGANGKVLMAASGEATGLKWETPAAAGGVTVPTVIQRYRGVNSPFTLPAAPTVGNRIVMGVVALGGSVTAVSSANTTWTQIGTDQAQNSNNTSIWVGVCAGSPGDVITLTKSGTTLCSVLEVADALTPTVGTTVVAKEAGAMLMASTAPISVTAGHFLAASVMTDAANNGVGAMLSCPFTGLATNVQYTAFVIGYAPDGDVMAIGHGLLNSSSVTYLVEIT